ncbi:hypothetical protein M9H77_12293 [Catharanthus roseus]|uniref:Uncharacterized protein n=1 Tax=Catharanthus roseus TaxID=4058 RepID=A0ACC0BGX9_CATRO|nr:hypothetical protein M9H77_12293 [Catharanthus roseus]
MVSDEPSMLYSTLNNDNDEVDGSDGDDAVSSQSESDDDNDPKKGEFHPPLNPENPVNPVTENIVQQWESSQWFSNASCGKWQTYTLSCSHVLAVCRENGSRTDTYVSEIYSRQTYRRTYQVNFHLVLSKNFWRDVPFNLTFCPPNMKKERGRKQGK